MPRLSVVLPAALSPTIPKMMGRELVPNVTAISFFNLLVPCVPGRSPGAIVTQKPALLVLLRYDRMIRGIIYKNKAQFSIPCIDWILYMKLPRLDSLTIRQLRVFCTVARLLSYTRAAEELGCQQPTASALVAELERTTQLTLLEQRGKHLTLTDEGHELYAHAEQVVAAADEAWWAMAERRGSMTMASRPLRVAADTTVGTYVLPRLLGAFHRQHPNMALQLSVANRAAVRASLLAGEV